jgi:hypothetical protein
MKAVCVLVLIYSGHPGHRDGTHGARQGVAFSQQEGDELAKQLTSRMQTPHPGKPSGTHDRVVCEKTKS